MTELFDTTEVERESIKVLNECIGLQIKKSRDYQNPNSRIKQADYYRHGVDSIQELVWAKTLRIESLIAGMKTGQGANYESLEDSYKDIINYASFAVSYLRGKIPGQDQNNDMFNQALPVKGDQ
jgi:hypothetical protein